MRLSNIGVQLQPNVFKVVVAVVPIRNFFLTVQVLFGIVDTDIDFVVDGLLPVGVAGVAGCGSVVVGRWKDLFELPKLVLLIEFLDGRINLRKHIAGVLASNSIAAVSIRK